MRYRAATESEFTEPSGEFPDVVKSVGEARPPEVPKNSAAATAATVVVTTGAKSLGVGGARPPRVAKFRATSTSRVFVQSKRHDQTAVAKSVGGARPSGVAKYSGATVSESEIGESSHEASSSGEDEIRDEVWGAVLVAAVHTNSPPDH